MKLHNRLIWMLSLIVIIGVQFNLSAQEDLKRIKVVKEISMKVPASFETMARADRISRYVSARDPLAMFTNKDRTIDLGINATLNKWEAGNLEIVKDFYKAGILNLFTEVNFIQEDIRKIGDRQFVVFEFLSKISDENNTFGSGSSLSKYTYIQYTIYDDKVLLFNFTAPARLRNVWAEPAKEMMESVRIKP